MEKFRIYELAKELNTTSKRLIEKLAEINISVKNHMSYIEKEQLDALYKHIGISTDKDKKEETGNDKKSVSQSKKNVEVKQDKNTTKKNVPRIIRTTEIHVDDSQSGNSKSVDTITKEKQGKTDKKENRKREFTKSLSDSSGLRMGFVRDSEDEYMSLLKEFKQKENKNNVQNKKTEPAKTVKQAESDLKKSIADKPAKQNVEDKKELKQKDLDKKEKLMETDKILEKIEDKKEEKDKNISKENRDNKIMSSDTKEDVTPKKEISGGSSVELKGAVKVIDNDLNLKSREPKEVKSKGETVKVPANTHEKREENRGFKRDIPKKKPDDKGVGKSFPKDLKIPKYEGNLENVKKDEVKFEPRKEDPDKEVVKEVKREGKKELVKSNKKEKIFKAKNIITGQKKGIGDVLNDDYELEEIFEEEFVKIKKQKKKDEKSESKQNKHIPHKAVLTHVKLRETVTVKELAETLKKTVTEVIKKLMNYGLMVTVNNEIDFDTAAIIAEEFGIKAEKEIEVTEEDILFDDSEDKEEDLASRPPVVVVMGHVDHGKTSLLDAIRKTSVTEDEAGGITQHIGAYMVNVGGRKITFLDTPGHEAFTAMRARGAQVTDVAILVVAADDGVMPQTIEAINHAKAANVTIIVAVNKIDKPNANPDRVKQELTEYGLVSEEWGGDTIVVEISAKKRQNIDTLLEMVLLASDMLELKANPNRQAKGTIIEAKLDKNRGAVATVLVQRGTLRVGDCIITGTTVGRVRAMTDDKGNFMKEAGPSTPAEIIGLSEVPEAGEIFYAVKDEKTAKHLVEKRKTKQREEMLKSTSKISLDDLFSQIQEGKVKELGIIIKADVQGSVEALKHSLEKLSNEEVKVKIIHSAVGAVTESDVSLAQVSNAIIIGFNVRPGPNVADLAAENNVDLRLYRVIYNAIEDVEAAIKGMLSPTYKESVLGRVEIRQIFKISGIGTIAGCYVTEGKITRNCEVRIVRDGIVVHEGKLASLKRFKDDVKEVAQGYECGLSIERFNDIKEGDIVEPFIIEEIKK